MDPSVISGLKEASPEPGGSQVSVESQEELTSGLDVGECEKRAREMLGVGRYATVAVCLPRGPAAGGPLVFPHL